jgi:hypothetical protein
MFPKHSKVFGSGIAPMTRKSILGVLAIKFIHDSVTGNLGENTGGGDAEADPIPPNKGRMFDGEPLHGETIHKGMDALMSICMKTCYRPRHCKMCCSQNIKLSDFFRSSLSNIKANRDVFC